MSDVKAEISEQKYLMKVTSTDHILLADEPLAEGGKNIGFSPFDLLCASLATCTCATLRMYADRKGWPIKHIETKVSFEKTDTETVFKRIIRIQGTISDVEKKRLLNIAELCPVSKILKNTITLNTNVI